MSMSAAAAARAAARGRGGPVVLLPRLQGVARGVPARQPLAPALPRCLGAQPAASRARLLVRLLPEAEAARRGHRDADAGGA